MRIRSSRRRASSRDLPDEEGTENYNNKSVITLDLKTVQGTSPMKRGLKDRVPSRQKMYTDLVQATSPMKRGLK